MPPKKSAFMGLNGLAEGACPGPKTKQPDVPDGPAIVSFRLSFTLGSPFAPIVYTSFFLSALLALDVRIVRIFTGFPVIAIKTLNQT